jgi:RNA polymerase sigma-70 factor (ECF subfamily)
LGRFDVRDDRELLRLSGRGDDEAFKALVDRHAPYLFGIAHGLTANPADAEDMVQETFLAAAQGGYRGEAAVRTWLVAILVRRAAMMRRTASRRGGTHLSLSATPEGSREPAIDVAASGGNASAGAEAKLDLATMLSKLSDDHRAVIVLRELEGMSYEEMARALGVPRGTIESRLYRAREELRRLYKGYLD